MDGKRASLTNQQPGRPFEFFQLPRELRDIIYGHTLIDKVELERQIYTSITVKQCINPRLLGICTQFTWEYLRVAEKHTLIVLDQEANCESPYAVDLPKVLRFVAKLDIRLWLIERLGEQLFHYAHEVAMSLAWIRGILMHHQQSRLPFSICVNIEPLVYGGKADEDMIAYLRQMTYLDSLESMRVYYWDLGWCHEHFEEIYYGSKLMMEYQGGKAGLEWVADSVWEDCEDDCKKCQ